MHTLTAVNILLAVTSHPIKHSTFIPFFTSTHTLQASIRYGFVESLEAEENQVCINYDIVMLKFLENTFQKSRKL